MRNFFVKTLTFCKKKGFSHLKELKTNFKRPKDCEHTSWALLTHISLILCYCYLCKNTVPPSSANFSWICTARFKKNHKKCQNLSEFDGKFERKSKFPLWDFMKKKHCKNILKKIHTILLNKGIYYYDFRGFLLSKIHDI